MKIIFVNVGSIEIDNDNLEPNLGALYIASNLQMSEYNDINIYEIKECKTEKEVENKINNIPFADIYSFTTFCTNYYPIKKCINHIRNKYPNAFIILGGPNASALPIYTIEDSKCDFLIVGEGEDTFLYLVKELEKMPIRNEYYNNLPTWMRILESIPYKNIDDLPTPAWNLVNLDKYTRVLNGERVISIISSRGCPNHCTHCNSTIMGGGHKIRFRSVSKIIEEIKYLQSLGYNSFRFNDDNFTCRGNLKELTLKLKKLNIQYRIFAHIRDLTDEACKLLSESGCVHVSIGIESMNPDNLKFLRKNTNVDIVDVNLRNVKQYGMISRCYFIVGLPFDNNETIEKYFWIASLLPFNEYAIYPLLPYPGTEIYKHPEKFGYTIIEKDWTKYFQIGENRSTCFALDHTNFSHKDVERWLQYIYILFEKRNKIHNSQSDTK